MSARAARVTAHAKLNLLLRVLGRDEHGFHMLETVFVRLALGDAVTVRTGVRGRSLDCRGADVGPVERNLAWRAAVAFADTVGWPAGFAIEIEKRIPVGGGLGGGSADAGAVLRALAALAPEPPSSRALLAVAAALGSDVPFLSTTHAAALAWGRGERMLALPPLRERAVVLALPAFGVSTAEAFGWLDADRGAFGPAGAVLQLAEVASWEGLATVAANDFEAVVERRHPELAELRDALRRAGAEVARLSGSGSTVFGIFAQAPSAERLRGMRASVVETRTLAAVPPVSIEH